MKIHTALVEGAILLILAASVAYAHHPFAAEYDWTKPVTVIGTVEKFEWMNPHSLLRVDARDDKGQMRHWVFELGGPATLTRMGWTQTLVKAGDRITVEGWLARDKSDRANAKSVRLSNGREFAGGSSILDIQPPTTKPSSN